MRVLVYEIDPDGADVTIALRCKNQDYIDRAELKELGSKRVIPPVRNTRTDWIVPAEADVYNMASMADLVDEDAGESPVTYEVTVWQGEEVVREQSAKADSVRIRAKEFPGTDAAVYMSAQLIMLA